MTGYLGRLFNAHTSTSIFNKLNLRLSEAFVFFQFTKLSDNEIETRERVKELVDSLYPLSKNILKEDSQKSSKVTTATAHC